MEMEDTEEEREEDKDDEEREEDDDNSIDPELANKLNYIYRDFGKDAELEKVEKQ